MKEVKYDTNKWKAIRFHELEELILLVSILPKAIYRFNAIFLKIHHIFHTTKTCKPKLFIEKQNVLDSQLNHEKKKKKKNKAGGIMRLDIIHNSMVLACVHERAHTHIHTHTHTNRHMYSWKIIEDPRIGLDTYGQQVYATGGKNIQQGKTFFVKIVFGELDKYMIKNKIGTFAHII